MTNLENLYINWLNKNNIEIRDEVLQRYGFHIFIRYALIIFLVLIISIILDNFLATLILMTSFSILRSRIGGLHFKNSCICFIVTLIFLITLPIIWRNINIPYVVEFGVCILNIFIIFIIGPIDCDQKKLTDFENKINKKYAIYISCFYFFIIISIKSDLVKYMILSIIINIISLLISKISFVYQVKMKNI